MLLWINANQLLGICVWEIPIYGLKAEFILCFFVVDIRYSEREKKKTKNKKFIKSMLDYWTHM